MRDAEALGQGVSCKGEIPFLPVNLPAEIGKSVNLTCEYPVPAQFTFLLLILNNDVFLHQSS